MTTIFNAGLRVFPIFQAGGYTQEYFHRSQGESDATDAIYHADRLGIPNSTIIYFAVDYDYMDAEVTSRVIPYFQGINRVMQNAGSPYRVGIYGSRNICMRVKDMNLSCSSFVGGMSTGYSGNLGFTMPRDWAFNQFSEITIGNDTGRLDIDKNDYSGRDPGFDHIDSDPGIVEPIHVDTGSSSRIMANRAGLPVKVYRTKQPFVAEPTRYEPIDQIDIIPVGACYSFQLNNWINNYERDTVYYITYQNSNGEEAHGYIWDGVYPEGFGSDEEHAAVWEYQDPFHLWNANSNNALISAPITAINGVNYYTFTLRYETKYYRDTTLMGTLPVGTTIAIQPGSKNATQSKLLSMTTGGASYPNRILVVKKKVGSTWQNIVTSGNAWIEMQYGKGSLPGNRNLK